MVLDPDGYRVGPAAPPLGARSECVVMMMGAAGSGKSTLAEALAAGHGGVVVSYDEHQRMMPGDTGIEAVSRIALEAAWRELDALCAAGVPVVVDGTHSQPERRAVVRTIARRYGRDTVVVVVRTSLEICIARQRQRVRRVPPADIASQHAVIEMSLPTLAEEGHASIMYYCG